jgi:hypothetical protein
VDRAFALFTEGIGRWWPELLGDAGAGEREGYVPGWDFVLDRYVERAGAAA